jgi:hypothetical protein
MLRDNNKQGLGTIIINNQPSESPLIALPPDVVAVIHGEVITKADVLETKRRRQREHLAQLRHCRKPIIKPCFVWTFKVEYWAYHGWHLYIRTLKHDWWLRDQWSDRKIILKIMSLFPCGLLPMWLNFYSWKRVFAECYPRSTEKRPTKQGMVQAWALVEGRELLDVAMDKEQLIKKREGELS